MARLVVRYVSMASCGTTAMAGTDCGLSYTVAPYEAQRAVQWPTA